MDYTIFVGYFVAAAVLVAGASLAIFWLVRREEHRMDQLSCERSSGREV
jgi:hypothetical protein